MINPFVGKNRENLMIRNEINELIILLKDFKNINQTNLTDAKHSSMILPTLFQLQSFQHHHPQHLYYSSLGTFSIKFPEESCCP